MREIEFRAWDGEKMILPSNDSLYHLSIIGELYFDAGSGGWEPVEADIMQYTGLKDKNGVKAFEDDIARYRNGGEGSIAQIKFLCGGFVLWTHRGFHGFGRACGDFEIIGNIHQNPDLLENVA